MTSYRILRISGTRSIGREACMMDRCVRTYVPAYNCCLLYTRVDRGVPVPGGDDCCCCCTAPLVILILAKGWLAMPTVGVAPAGDLARHQTSLCHSVPAGLDWTIYWTGWMPLVACASLGRSKVTRHSQRHGEEGPVRRQTDRHTVRGRACRVVRAQAGWLARHELKEGVGPAGLARPATLSSPLFSRTPVRARERSDRHHMPAHTHRAAAMISPSHGPCDAAGREHQDQGGHTHHARCAPLALGPLPYFNNPITHAHPNPHPHASPPRANCFPTSPRREPAWP
jgi:hypothetical protein